MRIIASFAAATTVGVLMMLGGTAPASAAQCIYVAVNEQGYVLEDIIGYGTAIKQGNACDRARRECNRKLERAYRRGELPRGVVCRRGASGA